MQERNIKCESLEDQEPCAVYNEPLVSGRAARDLWRQELAAREDTASRQENTRYANNADTSSNTPASDRQSTSRHDPKNGKKHKRTVKKAKKKAEQHERALVNADRSRQGLGDLPTKSEEWHALDRYERRCYGKEKGVAGWQGKKDGWREGWMMQSDTDGDF